MAALVGVALCLAAVVSHGAEDPTKGDVRDIRVGARASELPLEGFVGHRCVAPDGSAGESLATWTEFARCPERADRLREVAFEFDDSKAQWAAVNDKWEGTKISGHPVVLSLLFADDGVARALHINTDPTARAYLRKKAFLLRLRVLGRYGRDGWTCTETAAAGGVTPVGGMYINEQCTKRFANRELTLVTRLYRGADQTPAEYTNSTRLEIVWLGEG